MAICVMFFNHVAEPAAPRWDRWTPSPRTCCGYFSPWLINGNPWQVETTYFQQCNSPSKWFSCMYFFLVKISKLEVGSMFLYWGCDPQHLVSAKCKKTGFDTYLPFWEIVFLTSSPGAAKEGFINLIYLFIAVMWCDVLLLKSLGTCMAKVKPVKPIVCLLPLSNLRYYQMWSASIPFQLPSGEGDPGN